jgi:hypothetical protein
MLEVALQLFCKAFFDYRAPSLPEHTFAKPYQ